MTIARSHHNDREATCNSLSVLSIKCLLEYLQLTHSLTQLSFQTSDQLKHLVHVHPQRSRGDRTINITLVTIATLVIDRNPKLMSLSLLSLLLFMTMMCL